MNPKIVENDIINIILIPLFKMIIDELYILFSEILYDSSNEAYASLYYCGVTYSMCTVWYMVVRCAVPYSTAFTDGV